MFKNLYSKIAVFFIGILLVITTITGGMLYFFLGDFVTGEKEVALDNAGDNVIWLLKNYIDMIENPMTPPFLQNILLNNFYENLNLVSKDAEASIWIVSKDGEIVAIGNETYLDRSVIRKLESESGRLRLPDERQYSKKVMQEGQVVKEVGDFYGLYKDTKVSWLTIQKPYKYKGEIQGAIYLTKRIPEINKARLTVFKFYIIAISIAVVISALLVYIFSLRLTKPLKQINNAAKQIANGEFNKRLEIASEDEIGQLAKSFNNMAVALENLENMRRAFIANVSHELRTPMTSIHGFIEGILDGTIPPEKQREYLSIVSEETKRLSRLTNDLLDLARMESGEIKLTFVTFNINELIRRCIIKLENQIISKDIHIEANFYEEPTYVYADKDSIERVILNLLHNAVKFVQDGGQIKIETVKSKSKAVIYIKDNGIGIDSEEINMIWDRFYKSDKSRSKDKTGTGLGLAIVKNIINEHGQEINVESEIGKGTVFYFTLNLSKEEFEKVNK
ncbi:HAMP domain-containing sensor histidine kinase [Acetivibrio clariflavus]|uniref:histidine kinase n=1 Tax=Acetivibrio clariflavus (strain DSM 19732 / NBRC 101661 / EBR45) TaxID=720554 RepID=G8LXU3_ACECE|nr:HAMP domain-containing sensor histidine kinase [Acetivibrio clariflavus]AEV68846.1 signal transduction histidine kinase [Acetivibrio clariflavus DSM 19732]